MAPLPTAREIAHDRIADCGRQGALDYLIDKLIDTDDETESANVGLFIDAVERAAAH